MADGPLIPVNVIAVLEEPKNQNPVVLLHDQESNRVLPIWVGYPEARAIAVSLNPTQIPRPLTHMLCYQLIEAFDGKLSKVVVDRLMKQTYHASMYIVRNSSTIVMDVRPSDAIAIALHAKVPIFVAKELMDNAGQENPLQQRPAPHRLTSEELEKMKQMIEEARKRELEG